MEMLEESRLGKISFECLPPRVVIHDILSYIYSDGDKWIGEFELFGYFKKDQSRYPWFIFRNVKIGMKNFDTVMNCSKLRLLILEHCSEEFLERLISVSTKMLSLEYLHFDEMKKYLPNIRIVELMSKLFSNPQSFPSVKSLLLCSETSSSHRIQRVDTTKWIENSHLFKRIEFLEINEFLGIENSRIFETKGLLSNCRKINLHGISFPSEVTTFLPRVEKVYLFDCRNIFIDAGQSQVNQASFTYTHPKMAKYFLDNIESVGVFKLYSRSHRLSFSDIPWIRYSLQKVKKEVSIDGIDGFESPIHFSETLISLIICRSNESDVGIFLQEYPSLENLRIRNVKFQEGVHNDQIWSVCSQLKTLRLSSLENLTPRFLQINSFENLEDFGFDEIRIEVQKKMNPFPKLKFFSFSCLPSTAHPVNIFNMLPLGCFPNLETLKIGSYYVEESVKKHEIISTPVIFNGFCRTSKIRILQLRNQEYISEEFLFKNCSWESLRSLDLSNIPLVTGKEMQLSTMENLEYICLRDMVSFTDDCFTILPSDCKYMKLKGIYLYSLKILHGNGWSFLCKQENNVIESFTICDLPEFTGEIFTKIDFPHLKSLFVSNSPNVTGRNWKSFPKLDSLQIASSRRFDLDTFLRDREEIFKTLDDLSVESLPCFTGDIGKSRIFQNLSSLSVCECENFSDFFFQQLFFPFLFNLEIDECPRIQGMKNWNKIPRIRKLRFRECESLGDEVFQSDAFESVKKLRIENCVKVEGKGWRYFENLMKFVLEYEEENEKTTPDFSEKSLRPFPSTCVFRRESD